MRTMLLSSPVNSNSNEYTASCLLYVVLLLMSFLHTGISSVRADVRCYCNLPACVSSGYMCKSSLGVCVSDHFGYETDESLTSDYISSSRHACLELVQTKQVMLRAASLECSSKEEVSSMKTSSFPVRTCCREDMCNYARTNIAQHHSSPIHRLNQSYMTGYFSNDDYLFVHGGIPPGGKLSRSHKQNDVWFKAAVIAVPITGGFILILLIVMAARMLKEDRKRSPSHQPTPENVRQPVDTRIVYGDGPQPHRLVLVPKSVSSAAITIHPPISNDTKDFAASVSSFDNATERGHHHHYYPNSLYRNGSIALSTDTSCSDSSKDKYFVFDV